MSKAVMISIRPGWCEKIASGEKTIEVRKTKPKLEAPFKCYIYCTVERAGYDVLWVLDAPTREKYSLMAASAYLENPEGANKGNGKVIGEFICNRIYELAPLNHAPDDVEQQACLTREEIVRYLKGVGYGWHISDLVIYDEPKMLGEFSRPFENCIDKVCDEFGCAACENGGHIKRPPQSWCYVEEVE